MAGLCAGNSIRHLHVPHDCCQYTNDRESLRLAYGTFAFITMFFPFASLSFVHLGRTETVGVVLRRTESRGEASIAHQDWRLNWNSHRVPPLSYIHLQLTEPVVTALRVRVVKQSADYRTDHSRISPRRTGTTSLTSTANRYARRASPSTFDGLKK